MSYVGRWVFHSIGMMNEADETVYLNAEEYRKAPMPYIDESDRIHSSSFFRGCLGLGTVSSGANLRSKYIMEPIEGSIFVCFARRKRWFQAQKRLRVYAPYCCTFSTYGSAFSYLQFAAYLIAQKHFPCASAWTFMASSKYCADFFKCYDLSIYKKTLM